jgi:ABC-2 type transport system permease protein
MTPEASAMSGGVPPERKEEHTNRQDAGAIYDLGYRSYDGIRLGRWYAVRALTLQSLRTAFGIGRSARAKATPFVLLAFATIPALGAVIVAAATGNALQVLSHEQNFARIAWIFALFCAGQAPELVGGDQQNKVLSLYFARALSRADYVLAKLTALTAALLIIGLTPQLVLFIGRAFVDENPWSLIQRDAHLLIPILTSAFLIALLFASFGLLVASITKRRVLATAAIIGTLMITLAAGSTLVRMERSLRYSILISPIEVSEGVTLSLFGKVPHPRSSLGRANLPGYVHIGTAVLLSGAFSLLVLIRYNRIQT